MALTLVSMRSLVFGLIFFSQIFSFANIQHFSSLLNRSFSSSTKQAKSCQLQFRSRKHSPVLVLKFGQLRKPRRGPLQRGVPRDKTESILDHVENLHKAVSIVAEKLPHLDRQKMRDIAIVHDLAESAIADYTPNDRFPNKVKQLMELETMKLMRWDLNQEVEGLGDYVFRLWIEYDQKLSEEAMWVKRLDKIDAAVRLKQHELEGYPPDEVYEGVREQLRSFYADESLKAIYERFLQEVEDTHLSPHEFYFHLLRTYDYRQENTQGEDGDLSIAV